MDGGKEDEYGKKGNDGDLDVPTKRGEAIGYLNVRSEFQIADGLVTCWVVDPGIP
jgi:hypothetical protein